MIEPRRIGLIVPSSNTTMETELPEMFRWRSDDTGEQFTWHSGRACLRQVNAEELDRMVRESDDVAVSIADAPVEVIAYACLIAVMARGLGAHRAIEERLSAALERAPRQPPIVTSAGALISGLATLGARRIAMVTPYMRPLAELTAAYIQAEGVEVADFVALEIPDNVEVGRIPSETIVEHARALCKRGSYDALVLSACVQMPSLSVVQEVENEIGIPVMTAATATARQILLALGLEPTIPNAGALLSDRVTAGPTP